MREPRHLTAVAGAVIAGGTLLAMVWLTTLDEAGRDLTAFAERRLPLVVLLAMLAFAAVVPFGVLAWSHDPVAAAGLTLAGTTVLLPLWAAWPDLDPRWRVLALAAGPLAVAGLALMARSWMGAALASSAALLHALVYDPFRDVGCARVCLEVPVALPMSAARLTLLAALALTVAAGFVLARALRRRVLGVGVAAGGALALAGLAVLRWRTVGDADAFADTLLAAVPVPGLVALPAVAAWMRATRRRFSLRRLARHLAAEPDGLLELGNTVDVSLLSPGQRLALRNAQLAAEARERLVEVQASQRRVVAAADAERQRIERDLHDGTQQRLVGVLIQLSGRGLADVEQQIREVLANLRTFTHHTFPPVLEGEGLAAALVEMAATSDAELRLDLHLAGPVPPEQARAVYALVSLADHGVIDVSVVSGDDGLSTTLVGPMPDDLRGVEDRFGALGGTLSRKPDRIEGSLPCVW